MGCESCVRELKKFKINRIRYDREKIKLFQFCELILSSFKAKERKG